MEKKMFKIEDKIAAQRKLLSSEVSQKVFRLLEERKREWLVCRDKIDTMKAVVEKLKRKYAKEVPQTNDKKIALYKSLLIGLPKC
jgi:trehalose-6-phosphate synthase